MGRGDSTSRVRPFRGSRRGNYRGRGDMNSKFKYNSKYDEYNHDNPNTYNYNNFHNYHYNEGYDYGSNEYLNAYPDMYATKYETDRNNEIENNGKFTTGNSKKSDSIIPPNVSLGKYNISKVDPNSLPTESSDNIRPIKSPIIKSSSESPLTKMTELNKMTLNSSSESKVNISSIPTLPKGPASIVESNSRVNRITLSSDMSSKNMIDIQQNKLLEPMIDNLPKHSDHDNQSQQKLLGNLDLNNHYKTGGNGNKTPENFDTISSDKSKASSPSKTESLVTPTNKLNSSIPTPALLSLPKGPVGKSDTSKQMLDLSISDEHESPNGSIMNTLKVNNNSLKRKSHSIYIPSYSSDDRQKRRAISTSATNSSAPTTLDNSLSINKEKPIENNFKKKNDVITYTMQNIRENETTYIDYKPDNADNNDNTLDESRTPIHSDEEKQKISFHNNNYEQSSKSEMDRDIPQLKEISFLPSQNSKTDKIDSSKIEETISFKNYNQQKSNGLSISASPEKTVETSQFVNGIISLVKPQIADASGEEKIKLKNEIQIRSKDKNQINKDSGSDDLTENEKQIIESKSGKESKNIEVAERENQTKKEHENDTKHKNMIDIESDKSTTEADNKSTDKTKQIKLHTDNTLVKSSNNKQHNFTVKKHYTEIRNESEDKGGVDGEKKNVNIKATKNENSVVEISSHGQEIKNTDLVSAKTGIINENDDENEIEVEAGNLLNDFDDSHTGNVSTEAQETVDHSNKIEHDRRIKMDNDSDYRKKFQRYRVQEKDKRNSSDKLSYSTGNSSGITDVKVDRKEAYKQSKFLHQPRFDYRSKGLDINLPPEILNLFRNSIYENIPSFRGKNSIIQNFSLFRVDRLLFSTKNLNIFQFDHTMVSTFMPNPELYTHHTYNELISRNNTRFNWYDHVLPELESVEKYNSGISECSASKYYYSKLRKIEEDLNFSDKTSMKYLSTNLHYQWSETLLSMVKTNVNGMLGKNILLIDRKCDSKKIYSDLSTLSKRGFTFHFVLFSNFFNCPNQGDSLIVTLLDEIYNRRFEWANSARKITIFRPGPSTPHTNISVKTDVIDVNIVYTAKRFSYLPQPTVEIRKIYDTFSKTLHLGDGKYCGKLTLAVIATVFRLSYNSILSLGSYLNKIDMLPERSKYCQFEFNFQDIFFYLGKVSSDVKKEFDRNVFYEGSILRYGKIENSVYAIQFLISADVDHWVYDYPTLIVAKDKRLTTYETDILLNQIDWIVSDSTLHFKFKFFECTKLRLT